MEMPKENITIYQINNSQAALLICRFTVPQIKYNFGK